MANQFVTDGGTLTIPGAYASYRVEANNSGLATTGVLLLVGEAEAGPDFSQEADLGLNSFGPDQTAEVVAKYKGGPVVDAFRGAVAATTDPRIPGSFSRAIVVKTNPSSKASSTLWDFNDDPWAILQDRSYGRLGNLVAREVVTKQAEVVPTTGSFTFLPPISSTNIDVRVNGGAATAITIAAQATPATFKTQVDAVPGVDVTGGVDLAIMGGGSPLAGNLSLTVDPIGGNTVRIDFSTNFGARPAAGDTLWIPAASELASIEPTNAGSYIITGISGPTSVTANSITARKLLNATGSPTVITAPVDQGSIAATGSNDVYAYSAMNIHLVALVPDNGRGKTLEINELVSGTHLLSYLCYTLGTAGPAVVTWINKAASLKVIRSGTEYIAQLNTSRQLDSITEELSAGGAIALQLSYQGTSASALSDGTKLTLTLVDGPSADISPVIIPLVDYPTLADLSTYIGTLPGCKAAPGSAIMGQQPSRSLDEGTFTFASTHGAYTGRIKQDAFKFNKLLQDNGILVALAARPAAGLPAPATLSFLSGGTKGATTNASFNAAVDALEIVRGNFVIPLFSRDAVDDGADNLTDAGSNYTIANIHAYTRAHVLQMSTLKRRRNRQAILSIKDSFLNDKATAANMAHFRCAMTFQDVKDAGSTGIVQFQPWMAAVKAAATQAGGLYRAIVHKSIAISGALQARGDFSDQNDSQMEDALIAGLLPIRREETGGFIWVSDQTTYGKDSNFVFNSLQATYVADLIAMTTAQRMERMFVGLSVAEVSASLALLGLSGIMDDFMRLKLISPSDDAPRGFKNAMIKISGPAMVVSLEVKLAGAVYWIPIQFMISQVQQSAGG